MSDSAGDVALVRWRNNATAIITGALVHTPSDVAIERSPKVLDEVFSKEPSFSFACAPRLSRKWSGELITGGVLSLSPVWVL